jgi:hypothetical protein
MFKRLGPSRDEGVVAGQLGADVHPTLGACPQQHATRTPLQRHYATAFANHRFQFAAFVDRQLLPVHAFQDRAYTADFNDSVD